MASPEPVVTHSFARALLNVVKKDGMALDDARRESQALRELLKQQPRLKVFLEGPQFREEDKEALVDKTLKGHLHDIYLRFLYLLLRRDRVELLLDILHEFEELIEREQGITPGKVTTAIELAPEEQERITSTLEKQYNKKFDFRFTVDPRIVGGVRVKYEDILIDSTIATYLSDLRMRLQSTRLAI